MFYSANKIIFWAYYNITKPSHRNSQKTLLEKESGLIRKKLFSLRRQFGLIENL